MELKSSLITSEMSKEIDLLGNAARVVLDYINQSSETDLAIFLISGGGSSLLLKWDSRFKSLD